MRTLPNEKLRATVSRPETMPRSENVVPAGLASTRVAA